ncbi:MAG: hypothetical protein IVW54_18580 [Candidatus Binataceae bacterium]|nr:hypothetical protein [Candidatus Binataceae bacterium]
MGRDTAQSVAIRIQNCCTMRIDAIAPDEIVAVLDELQVGGVDRRKHGARLQGQLEAAGPLM